MADLNHFTYGGLTPVLAYMLSFLGSLLGLVATTRARAAVDTGSRARWLVLAAWAIGGTGMWVTHFMAMVGFTVPGLSMRYDVETTVASWLVAVGVVGIGLFIVGFGRPTATKIIFAGLLTGAGMAAMHYISMGAIRMAGVIHYDPNLVVLSILIAVVAATVALWFTVHLRRGKPIAVAALIMAAASCGMHYAGMAAMRVTLRAPEKPIEGITPVTFLAPIVLFVILVVVTLFYALLDRPDGGVTEPPLPSVATPPPAPTPAQPAPRRVSGSFVRRPTSR